MLLMMRSSPAGRTCVITAQQRAICIACHYLKSQVGEHARLSVATALITSVATREANSTLTDVALEADAAAGIAFQYRRSGAGRVTCAAELDAQQGAMLHSCRRHVPATVQPVSSRRLCTCLQTQVKDEDVLKAQVHRAFGVAVQKSMFEAKAAIAGKPCL